MLTKTSLQVASALALLAQQAHALSMPVNPAWNSVSYQTPYAQTPYVGAPVMMPGAQHQQPSNYYQQPFLGYPPQQTLVGQAVQYPYPYGGINGAYSPAIAWDSSFMYQQSPTSFTQQPSMPFIQQHNLQQPYVEQAFAQQGPFAQQFSEPTSLTLALQPDAGGNLVTGHGIAGNKLQAVRRCTGAQVDVQLSTNKRTPHTVHLYGDAWQVSCAQAMIAAATQGLDVSTWTANEARTAALQQGSMGTNGVAIGTPISSQQPFIQAPLNSAAQPGVVAGNWQSQQQPYYAAGQPYLEQPGFSVTLQVPEWNLGFGASGNKLHSVQALTGAQVFVLPEEPMQPLPMSGSMPYANAYATVQVVGTPDQVAAAQAMLFATTDVTTWTPWDVQNAASVTQHMAPLPRANNYGVNDGAVGTSGFVEEPVGAWEDLPIPPPQEQPLQEQRGYEQTYRQPFTQQQQPYSRTAPSPSGQPRSGQVWSPMSAVRGVAKEV
jgi:hypothetical protein